MFLIIIDNMVHIFHTEWKITNTHSPTKIGDLVEMDVTENTALHRVHGYLTNDGFMVATWLPNRRGPVR